jgi:hypothetical protein
MAARRIVLTLLLALAPHLDALADGFRMKDGRYAGGPVTVLELTRDQRVTVETKRIVVLTEKQKRILRRDAGVAPSVLQVYSLRTAGKDCTCFDFNISIWFEPERIEVPHRYLAGDAEAAERMDEVESIE